ncbi:MAG: fimbrillin family protein [Prevotella sp.]
MKTTRTLLFALAAAALVGCSGDEENTDNSFVPVAAIVNGNISGTVSTRTTADNNWTVGDAIGVTVTSTGKTTGSNVLYTYGSGNFTSNSPIYFQDREEVMFKAYYPYTAESTVEKTITAADEATEVSRSKIDYLFASGATASVGTPTVSFTGANSFKHSMSRLTLTFKAGAGIADLAALSSYTVGGLVMTGSFSPSDGTAAASTTAAASDLTITLGDNVSGSTHTAAPLILFPQAPANGKFSVTLVFDGITYRATFTVPSQAFTSGYNVTYDITINKTGLTVSDATIDNWNTVDGTDSDASFFYE